MLGFAVVPKRLPTRSGTDLELASHKSIPLDQPARWRFALTESCPSNTFTVRQRSNSANQQRQR